MKLFLVFAFGFILSGCAAVVEMQSLNENVLTSSAIQENPLGDGDGFMLLRVNSEIHNNILIFKNLETKLEYRSPKLVGRYNTIVVVLPAGKYGVSRTKFNRYYFVPSEIVPEFEVVEGKINYPGDMDITISSREPESLSVDRDYVDRENTLPLSIVESKKFPYHYAFLGGN